MKSPALRTAGNIAAQRQKSIRSAKEDSMTDITIPPKALEGAKTAFKEATNGYGTFDDFIAATCLGLLKAWPGMQHCRWNELNAAFSSHLILPLPKENTND